MYEHVEHLFRLALNYAILVLEAVGAMVIMVNTVL